MENKDLLDTVRNKAQGWLSESYDAETRAQVQLLLDKEDPTDLIEAFYKDLEFGTGEPPPEKQTGPGKPA